jgi:hypothetical protein
MRRVFGRHASGWLPIIGPRRLEFELSGGGLFPSCRGVYNDALIRRNESVDRNITSLRTSGELDVGPATAGRPTFVSISFSEPDLPFAYETADSGWLVARLDRKRLGTKVPSNASWTRGVFDKEARRKPLAFAADAV